MRIRGKDAIYEVAAKFRDGCLGEGVSVGWPSKRVWNKQNIDALVDAYINAPDEGNRSFYDKFRDQLGKAPTDVHRIAADVLTLYLLFPSRIAPQTKLSRLEEVVSWKVDEIPESFDLIKRAFDTGGIGFPGAHYQTGQHWQISFFMLFAQRILGTNADAQNPDTCWRIAHEVEATLPHKSGSGPHVLVHLFFPDRFERIASTSHKRLIAGLLDRAPSANVDADVAAARQKIASEIGRSDFDFYDPDVEPLWRPPAVIQAPAATELGEKRVWIEKTLVEGRPDRIDGPYALGKALWSPQRDKGGGDTYRFMRDVRAGDVVLHLTDNEAFTGVSEVRDQAETFGGVLGTSWEGPSYSIPLQNFRKLTPPLSREVFFASPYRERLVSLIDEGERNLFYHRGAALNQGKYLTPASERLVDILEEAYMGIAGNSMFEPPVSVLASSDPSALAGRKVTLADVHASFSHALREARLVFGSDHESITRAFLVGLATKKFVILTGLSGSGKTQIALRFGDWLGENHRLLVPVRPDWTGSEALFGYEDVLQQPKDGQRAWQVSDTLEFMLGAARDPSVPYLLILDEMNLAHVERYFADVLSGMESGQTCLPNLGHTDGAWRQRREGGTKLQLPRNLLIAGTVNVDETTYLFSPKVLDRANTFEFRVRTQDLAEDAVRPGTVQAGDSHLVSHFLEVCTDEAWHVRNPAPFESQFVAELRKLHELLSSGGFEFGHRVFYEAVRFAALLAAAGEDDPLIALDHQIIQKILPRMHGSRRRLEAPLCALANYCFDLTTVPEKAYAGAAPGFDPTGQLSSPPKLPRSFDKARRMTTALRANQFTSFTE